MNSASKHGTRLPCKGGSAVANGKAYPFHMPAGRSRTHYSFAEWAEKSLPNAAATNVTPSTKPTE